MDAAEHNRTKRITTKEKLDDVVIWMNTLALRWRIDNELKTGTGKTGDLATNNRLTIDEHKQTLLGLECPSIDLNKSGKTLDEWVSYRNNWYERFRDPFFRFCDWFDSLTDDELDILYAEKTCAKHLNEWFRAPKLFHEWYMISLIPEVRRAWNEHLKKGAPREDRLLAIDVFEARTPTKYITPSTYGYQHHRKKGSNIFHYEIKELLKPSKTKAQFIENLNIWAASKLKGGTGQLPVVLQDRGVEDTATGADYRL